MPNTANDITVVERHPPEIQKLIVAKAKELGVTVNPRYGKWDPATADIVANDPASSAVTPPGN